MRPGAPTPSPRGPASPRTLLLPVRAELRTMGAYTLRGGLDLRSQHGSVVHAAPPSPLVRVSGEAATPCAPGPQRLLGTPKPVPPVSRPTVLTPPPHQPAQPHCHVHSSGLAHLSVKPSSSHFKELLSPFHVLHTGSSCIGKRETKRK